MEYYTLIVKTLFELEAAINEFAKAGWVISGNVFDTGKIRQPERSNYHADGDKLFAVIMKRIS